jgi:transposase
MQRRMVMGGGFMDVIVERVAGLDVSKADVKACVRLPRQGPGRRYEQQVRTFATMTRQLTALADWLAESGVELVVMEATGDYWKPVFYRLEHRFTVWLINARDVKKVPGRKTDVKDAEWLAQLAQHGLVSPSFVSYYKRMVKRRGPRRALVAVMHKILIAAWHMLSHDVAYHDLGLDYFHRRPDQVERRRRRLLHELTELGVDTSTLITPS